MSSMNSPPVFHDELTDPPKWPVTIGVLGCIWGGLTLLYNGCCQVAGTVIGKVAMGAIPPGSMPPEAQDQMNAQMALVGPIDILFMVVLTGVSALLLVSAIMLLRRKPIGVKLHLAYGIVATVILIAHVAWQISRADDYAQVMKQNPAAANGPMAAFANMGATMMIVSSVVIGLLRLGYPLFCLIWFGVVKKNADLGTNEVSI